MTAPAEEKKTRPNKGVTVPAILKKPVKKPSSKKAAAKKSTPKKRERIVHQKYDWDYARETFVSADPPISLKQLSDSLSIPYNYLRQRAGEERWTYLRVEEQRRLYKKKREEHARKVIDDALKFDENSTKTATLGQHLVMSRLVEIAELHKVQQPIFIQTLANLKNGVPVQKTDLYSVIRFTELKELALAAKLFQDMGRAAFGIEQANRDLEDATGDNSVENVISVAGELGKDDPKRLTAMLEAFERAGLVEVLLNDLEDMEEEDAGETIEGEVVETGHPEIMPTERAAMKELTTQ